MDQVLDLPAEGPQLCHILLRGMLGRKRGDPGLHDQPDVQQLVGQTQLVRHVGKSQRIVDDAGMPGHECPPAPADLQYVPGYQQLCRLPHRAAAHIQLLGQFKLVGQLFPMGQLAVDDQLADLLGHLLRQRDLLVFHGFKKILTHACRPSFCPPEPAVNW